MIDDIKKTDDWKNCLLEMAKLDQEWTGEKSSERLFDILSRVRSMGHPEVEKGLLKSRSPVRSVVMKALNRYPTSWIEKSLKNPIKVKKVKRGYSLGNIIALSGYNESDMIPVAFHELGHYFEHRVMTGSVSGIIKDWGKNKTDQSAKALYMAESLFYDRRTAGESLKWLGSGYGRDEKTRKDNFIHKYMGKDYGGTDFELVSMGFQYAYTDPKMLAQDPDMESWIYGILALYE